MSDLKKERSADMKQRKQISRSIPDRLIKDIEKNIKKPNTYTGTYDIFFTVRRGIEWNMDRTLYRELCSNIRDHIIDVGI